MYGFFTPHQSDGCYPRPVFDPRIGSKGDIVWFYVAAGACDAWNAYGPNDAYRMPSWFIDTLTGARENAAVPLEYWIFDAAGFNGWATANCLNEGSWADPGCGYPSVVGDGFIWYSGKPSGTYGIGGSNTIVVESLRIKLWRWGMNVMEYAKLLEAAGKSSVATTQIENMVILTESGNTWGSVAAWEAAREAMANEILGMPSDASAPSIPANLTATPVSSSKINLLWSASTDDVGVTGYKVYRNGMQIATAATNSYSDTPLLPFTTYAYTVSAYDASGKGSGLSSPASARTLHQADTSRNGCVSMGELNAFINRWKLDSSDPTIRELIEAIGEWKSGCPP